MAKLGKRTKFRPWSHIQRLVGSIPTKSIKMKMSIFLYKKWRLIKLNFSLLSKWFFIGFSLGNIFGSFLIFIRSLILWDGLIIFFILLTLEMLNFIIFYPLEKKSYSSFIFAVRIGILLGFFVDAYKVGS